MMLRDALRRLCVDGGWTYAVFWKIVHCGSTRHLIWADDHHEPSTTSSLSRVPGFEATCSFLDQDHCVDGTDQNGFQLENRIGLLLEKILRPKVHLGGCGIIGSALTGNHHWVLQNELHSQGYTSQELEEVKIQFSSGIQTIAVIPVLPYGVVQLGSTQMITQKEEFVHYVKGLFLQQELGSEALFSESNIKMPVHQKVQLHMLPELTFSPEVSEKPPTKMTRLIPSISDSCGPQGSKAPPSSMLDQLFCSLGSGIYEKDPTFVDAQLDSRQMFKTISESLNKVPQPGAHAAVKSRHFFSAKQEGQSGTTFGFSNAKELQEQHPNFINTKSVGQSSSMVGSEFNSSNSKFLKQSPGIGPHESSCHRRTLGASMGTLIGCQVLPDSNYLRDSTTASSLGIGESSLSTNVMGTGNFGLFPSSMGAKGTIEDMDSSFMGRDGLLDNTNFPNNNHLTSGEVTSTNTTSIGAHFTPASTSDKWKVDMKYQARDPASSSNSSVSRTFSSLESVHGCLSTNHGQGRQDFQVNVSDPTNTLIIAKGQITNDKGLPVHTLSRENSCLSFVHSSGDDLYDALGLDAKPRKYDGKLDALFSSLTETNASHNLDVDPVLDAHHLGISFSEIFSDSGHDQLLDAVVSKVNSNPLQCSENFSCKTMLTNTSQSVVGDFPSHACRLDSPGNMLLGTYPALAIENVGSLLDGSCSLGKTGNSPHREGDYKSHTSLWVEKHQSLKNDSTSSSNCKKIDEAGKLHKKRPKPGENPRPRPKDRQMIQDRVKELREIVPNGAKCSIDALLERTIKHMLFLQSVTKHADKLKETGEPKIINKGGLLLKDNFEGGATWAFEIGNQSKICPIIVEDLDPPRQLLVEMLCEDRGFFLEIADLIKGLGLTILKGVMEVRNAKVWARFAVEANRDVTRMDIFLSLVRLLEPTATTNVRSSQGLENIKERNMFRQSSIPATGVADHLQ